MITRKKDKILRDGIEVAVLEGEKVEYIGDGKRYRLPISKFLKDEGEEIEECPVIETWEMSAEEAFPNAPGLHSPYGDKDPDLVRWIHENHPEDFKNRYKGRKTIMDTRDPKEEGPTVKAVRAQREGFNDARKRTGYRPEHYEFEGIFEIEYKVGFKNGGGRV
jgi:hypothetical protein